MNTFLKYHKKSAHWHHNLVAENGCLKFVLPVEALFEQEKFTVTSFTVPFSRIPQSTVISVLAHGTRRFGYF